MVGVTVIFAADGTEPLLGCTALESAGFELDHVSKGHHMREYPRPGYLRSDSRTNRHSFRFFRGVAKIDRAMLSVESKIGGESRTFTGRPRSSGSPV